MTHTPETLVGEGQSAERLVQLERDFWNLQEKHIDDLYARPHDWRFIPALARKVFGPRDRFVMRKLRELAPEIDSVLDVGCGNGWAGLALARVGIKSIGVDVADAKIERAREQARAEGIDHLARFEAMDVMALDLEEKVDCIFASGSLHHFPDLERQLPLLVERCLRPGGYLILLEPHREEGMSPRLSRFIFSLPRNRLLRKHFDYELYAQVHDPKIPEGSFNIRSESPAGLEFFGDHVEVADLVARRYTVLEQRYFLHCVGHLSQAFHVFMKARPVKWLWERVVPLVAWWDARGCRKANHREWAEEVVIVARYDLPATKGST